LRTPGVNLTTIKRVLIIILIACGCALQLPCSAQTTDDQIKALKEQIDKLAEKVRILERERGVDQEVEAAKAKDAPKISVGANGLSISSADTNFVFQLHGLVQADNRTFFHDNNLQGNDTFLLRRARPIFSGTVYRDFDFYLSPDFGNTTVQILDAYASYRYAPWLQLRAGKFKTPVGLEQLQSDVATSFNERALPNSIMPNRDIGFQLRGDVIGGRLSYAVGIFNGVGDARSTSNFDFEDHREFAGRIFALPFRGTSLKPLQNFGFGLGGSWGNTHSNTTALPSTTGGTFGGFITDGQQQFFAYNPTNGTVVANGAHWRLSPQACYYWGPFGLLGEYVMENQGVKNGAASAGLENKAWQISGSWVLTGEDASYAGVVAKNPFDLKSGHWGAFQLVGRYAELDVDNAAFPVFSNPSTSASGAQAWSVGLNWYLNRDIRVNSSFSRTIFKGGGGAGATAPATITRQPEEVMFTRLQLLF
jgi:phosphate-selective porin OprO/OprP